MPDDQGALSVRLEARIEHFEQQMTKAVRGAYGAAERIEKAFAATNDNVNRGLARRTGKFSGAISASADEARAALGGLTSGAGAAAGPLAALGPLGLAAAAGVGALGLALVSAAKAAQFADDLAATAAKIGITAEALQELNFAAESTDIPVEKANEALQNLNGSIGAIQTNVGAGKLKAAFAELGLGPEQLKNIQTADQLLPVLADKLAGLGSQAAQVQIARKLGIEALLPLLQQGATGIAAFRREARDLGLVMDETTVQSAANLNEELRRADERLAAASRRVGVEFVPALTAIKRAAADAAGALAGMLSLFNRAVAGPNADQQIQAQLGYAQSARQRATALRSGSALTAAGTGVISGLNALSPAGRERAAREQDATAARADGQIEAIARRRDAASLAAASAAASAAGGSVFADKDGKPKRESKRKAPGDNLRPVEVQSLETNDLLDQLAYLRSVVDRGNELVRPDSASGLVTTADGMARSAPDPTPVQQYLASLQDLNTYIEGAGVNALDSLADGLANAIVNARNLGDVAANVFLQLSQDILASTLKSTIAGPLSKLFGGALSKVLAPGANANGTDNWRGGLSWVGERGPELINLNRGAQVMSNERIRAAVGGGQGGGVTINFNGPVNNAREVQLSANRAAARLSMVQASGRRGV